MVVTEVRDEVAAERRELAAVLGDLPPGSWQMPSLCAGWRVREVVAHITMPFRYSAAKFMTELVRSGGRFNRMADRCARRDARAEISELLAALRDNVRHPWKPPGAGFEAALTHDVIHGLDITTALGIDREIPVNRLRPVLDTITAQRSLQHFDVDLGGVQLRADDADWSYGSGEVITGHAQDLALVLCGRKLPAGKLRGSPSAAYAAR